MMDRDAWDFLQGAIVGLVFGTLLNVVYFGIEATTFRMEAIDHGYAEYAPDTGAFRWKEKAEK